MKRAFTSHATKKNFAVEIGGAVYSYRICTKYRVKPFPLQQYVYVYMPYPVYMPKLYWKVKINGKWTFRAANVYPHIAGYLVTPDEDGKWYSGDESNEVKMS